MVTINVVGVGGTGSWLIPPLVKFVSEGVINVYDPDIVEFKNTLRQNFTYIDVGDYKSKSIKRRFSTPRVNIKDHNTSYIDEYHFQRGDNRAVIMISCVDNILARRALVKNSMYVSAETGTPVILIDSGNEQISGNVYLSLFKPDFNEDSATWYSKIMMPDGMIELLNRESDVDRPRISCANLQEQTVVANYRMASEILNMLMNIGINKNNILNLQNIDIDYLWELVELKIIPNAHYVSFRNQYESSINIFTSNDYQNYLKKL